MYQQRSRTTPWKARTTPWRRPSPSRPRPTPWPKNGAATAAAENPDAVFEDLPDTLIAPAEGPTPTLTPDRYYIYQTGDPASTPMRPRSRAWFSPTASPAAAAATSPAPPAVLGPSRISVQRFIPDDFSVPGFAYDWQGYGQQIPFGLLGTFTSSSGSAEFQGATSIVKGDGVGIGDGFIGIPELDLVRTDQRPRQVTPRSPSPRSATRAMHFSGDNASLLNVANTPGAIGVGGYSQAQIPDFAASLAAGFDRYDEPGNADVEHVHVSGGRADAVGDCGIRGEGGTSETTTQTGAEDVATPALGLE